MGLLALPHYRRERAQCTDINTFDRTMWCPLSSCPRRSTPRPRRPPRPLNLISLLCPLLCLFCDHCQPAASSGSAAKSNFTRSRMTDSIRFWPMLLNFEIIQPRCILISTICRLFLIVAEIHYSIISSSSFGLSQYEHSRNAPKILTCHPSPLILSIGLLLTGCQRRNERKRLVAT